MPHAAVQRSTNQKQAVATPHTAVSGGSR